MKRLRYTNAAFLCCLGLLIAHRSDPTCLSSELAPYLYLIYECTLVMKAYTKLHQRIATFQKIQVNFKTTPFLVYMRYTE